MRKTFTVMTIVMALVLSTMTAALAQSPPWDGDNDIIDSDEQTTTVAFTPVIDPTDPKDPQRASITLTGPDDLGIDEEGTYTVTVANTSPTRVLDEWALGLSVTNIQNADDLTITFPGSDGFDITGGTSGVEVAFDATNSIIYLRGSDDPSIATNTSETFTFDASFADQGSFTGTAYVINEDLFRDFSDTGASPEFVPYYNADGSSSATLADHTPTTKPLNSNGDEFETGASYVFDQCTFDRTRWETSSGTVVMSDNRQKCYNDGVVEYEHYTVQINQDHPDFEEYVEAGHTTALGGGWVMVSFEVVTPTVMPVDVTDRDSITTWAGWPA